MLVRLNTFPQNIQGFSKMLHLNVLPCLIYQSHTLLLACSFQDCSAGSPRSWVTLCGAVSRCPRTCGNRSNDELRMLGSAPLGLVGRSSARDMIILCIKCGFC